MSRAELASRVVGPEDAPAEMWLLHGILGSGRNWMSMARRLCEQTGWAARLVDLRHHGDTPPVEPPDDLAAVAADLRALVERVGPPDAVIGHSFGGKCALALVREDPELCSLAWSLDSPPGPVPADSPARAELAEVFAALRAVPQPLEERQEVVRRLQKRGLSPALAQWMTTNLRRRAEGDYVWRFNLDGAGRLIESYFEEDLWPTVRDSPVELHLVRAARSDRWSEEECARLQALDPARAHVLPEAGHWLHVDAPEALCELIAPVLARRA